MALTVIILLLAVGIFYHVLRHNLERKRQQEVIRRNGCQPIVKWPSTDRLGRDYDQIKKQSYVEGRVNLTALKFYQRCGSSTYEIHSMNERVIHTLEPLNHQTIATKPEDWIKDVRPAAFPFFGTNILDQQGAAWKRTRDLVNPLFKRAELRDVEFFRKFVDRFIERIPRDGSTIDLQPLIRKLFLDSSTEFIFGESIDSLRDMTNESDEFIATFNRAVAGAGKRIRPTGYTLKLNNLGTWDRAWLADCKAIHDYVDGCIARYRNRVKVVPTDRKRYVLIEGMSKDIEDPIALRFQLLGIFSIARETSAMAFSNVMFVLARNPHVWAELRKELFNAGIGHDITFEQLNSLSHFRNTVFEAFRLHSPITRLRRVSARDTVLPRGGGVDGSAPAFVPKGTTIWGDRYPAARNTKIWGDDAEDFRPSRFEGRQLGWEFQPFSGGPRICPANQQVISQCMYLLVRLVQEFESIENRDPCLEYIEGVLMCFESRNGCKIAFGPA